MNATPPFFPLLGQILLAVLFLLSGVAKIAGPAATLAYIGSAHLPLPTAAYAIAVIVEVGGGLLLVAGYQVRAVALVLAIYSVATAIAFHHDFADQSQMINFLKNIAITGGLLQVVAFGAGPFSVDAARTSHRP